jgi:hypothetical protein
MQSGTTLEAKQSKQKLSSLNGTEMVILKANGSSFRCGMFPILWSHNPSSTTRAACDGMKVQHADFGTLLYREYEAYLELEGADKRWWDYRALFKNRSSVYRLMSNCTVSLFGQWAGNGAFSTLYIPLTTYLRPSSFGNHCAN